MEWISVNDRLPEKNTTIDVIINGKYRLPDAVYSLKDMWNKKDNFSAYMRGDNGMYWADITSDVTHWMPIPEPPKEDTP